MNRTTIEWVKNPDETQGYTWNPITGCLNHDNGLCKGGGFPCYAYKLASGRLRERYLANDNVPDGKEWEAVKNPFYPRFWPERFWALYNISSELSKPKGIFVCDMSDLFGVGIPEEWTKSVLKSIQQSPQHRFYLLTKQPQNLPKWSPFPDNCWPGVTVCTNGMMSLAMGPLSRIKASIRYISFEPLLGSIGMKDHMSLKGVVDWVIIGAQTKPYKPPRIEWVQEIVEAADRAGIAVFQKDNLKPLLGSNLRQELPK